MPTLPEPDSDEMRLQRYSEQVQVIVAPIDSPEQDSSDEEWIIGSVGGAGGDHESLVREVEGISLAEGPERAASYVRRATETRINWGADAALFTVFLGVSSSLAGSAIWASVAAVARKWAQRIDDSDSTHHRPFSESEAEERVRWLLQSRYELKWDSLELISIELHPPAAATVVMRSPHEWEYRCDLRLEHNLVTVGYIKRHRVPPGH